MTTTPQFAPQTERVRIKLVGHQHIKAEPAKVFPMHCVVREYEWIEDWDVDIVYTESGVGEMNSIARMPEARSLSGSEVWITTLYEPPYRSGFVAVGSHHVAQFQGTFAADEQGHTDIRWDATYTALDEEGDRILNEFDQQGWVDTLKELGEAGINRVLLDGKVYRYSPTKTG